ncbi:tolloid-like protein 1 isoform X2 [Branchiostoma floridae]|uniref:Tolloid-like protein 1 isoform X2 n=1 Tax=Branchiostoma floridae TaxID=7739 RepID=A0A9J7MPV1_BRAFL|nr:tolloid-like protein 1 isoform X2 [Branchiostoma floridae]
MRRNVRYVRNVSNQLAVSLGYFIRSLLLAAEMGAMGGDMGYIVRIVFILGFLGCIMGQTDPCGRNGPMVMQGYTGTISSPNYPQTYPTYQECSWHVISTQPERQLWLVFDEIFSIESFIGGCSYDYLTIHDGPDEKSHKMNTLCGDVAPPSILLSGNEVFVKFKTDGGVNKEGFRLTWRTCAPHLLLCDEGSTCVRTQDQCDMRQDCQDWKDELNCDYQSPCGEQIFTDGPGNITTLNYPVFFPPGLSCNWNIVATQGKRLRASFTGLFDVPCPTAVNVTEVSLNGNVLNGTFTFCGSQTPPDIIVTTKERITVNFQPPMEAPGKGFALHWETSCQENYFSCPEGFCLRPEKVCDGNDDCQQGEDESYSTCPVSTTSSTSSPLVTTGRTPEIETTPTRKDVTSGKWYLTPTVRTGVPNDSTPTPRGIGTGTMFTTPTTDDHDHGNKNIDSYPRHLCYSCHDDGACASPVNSSLPVTECFDDQDCWVERILGPGKGKGKERIVYRRGCGSLCPDHWKQEDCTDGWLEVCLLCCSEDLCNSQLLSGDDKRFSNQVWEGSSVVGVLEPNWIYFLAASLSAVSMFTA